MITALCVSFFPFGADDASSALRICGRLMPPRASPPIFKKCRRECPSQNDEGRCPSIDSIREYLRRGFGRETSKAENEAYPVFPLNRKPFAENPQSWPNCGWTLYVDKRQRRHTMTCVGVPARCWSHPVYNLRMLKSSPNLIVKPVSQLQFPCAARRLSSYGLLAQMP